MDREALASKILEFIRSEVQDGSIPFGMETPIEQIKMDSIDVIHVIFKAEEEFDVEIDVAQDKKFEKVGDFVNELIGFIEKKKTPAAAQKPVATLVKSPASKPAATRSEKPAPVIPASTKARAGIGAQAGKSASKASAGSAAPAKKAVTGSKKKAVAKSETKLASAPGKSRPTAKSKSPSR